MKIPALLAATALASVAAVGLSTAHASDRLETSTLAQRDPDFAQMLATIQPGYVFAYDRQRDQRLGNLYLLTGVPILPVANPSGPLEDRYFSIERPTTALVSSFVYPQSPSPIPVENVLVHAKLVSPSLLSFRCTLYLNGPQPAQVCDGRYDLATGDLLIKYLDTLFEEMQNRIYKQPDGKCVREFEQKERIRNECKSAVGIDGFRCSLAAYFYARHACRTALR